MGILSLLFGKRPVIKCEKCGRKGPMYLRGGAYEGQFRTIGKDDSARLIIQCDGCHTNYTYDPIWGKVQKYDALKEMAENHFGLKIKDK